MQMLKRLSRYGSRARAEVFDRAGSIDGLESAVGTLGGQHIRPMSSILNSVFDRFSA